MTHVDVTYDALKDASKALIDAYCMIHSVEFPPDFKPVLEALSDDIINTLIKKNHDYGDAWQRWGMFTGLIRLNDKLLRVQTLGDGTPAMVVEEGIDMTLVDIVGYGLLLALWLRGQHPRAIDTGEEDTAMGTSNKCLPKQLQFPFTPLNCTREEQRLKAMLNDPCEDKKIYRDIICWRTDAEGKQFIFETDLSLDWGVEDVPLP